MSTSPANWLPTTQALLGTGSGIEAPEVALCLDGDWRVVRPADSDARSRRTEDGTLLRRPSRQTEASVEGCPGLKRITYRNGRSVWAYRFADPLTGKRSCVVIGDCDKVDEIGARVEVRLYAKRLQAGLVPRQSAITLAAFFDRYYLPWAQAHKRSWRDDQSRFNLYIREALGQRVLSTITTPQMQRLGDELCQGQRTAGRRPQLSDGTVNHVLALFKAVYREAANAELIEHNPAKRLRMLRLDNLRHEIYTDDELSRILPALQAINPLVRLLFVCLLATGARIGELLNARHADIDGGARTLQLTRTKSGRPMCLPLSATAMRACAEIKTLARPGNPHLFPAARGTGPMSPPRKAFQKVLANLDIRNKTFHDARRTAISTVVSLPGLSLLDASRLANHASTRITETRYVVLGSNRLRLAVDGLDRSLPLQLGLKSPPTLRPSVPSVVIDRRIRFVTGCAA